MRKFLLACAAMAAVSWSASAEIVKTAVPDCTTGQLCFYWWPKLPTLTGWHGDPALNLKMGANGSNVLIPDGKTFSGAPAILYARAIYIARYDWQNKTQSTLASFIADDIETFRKEDPAVVIADAPPLTTADGQVLKVVSFARPDRKNWDCVAYGQEDGYYLMFVMSASSEAGYRDGLAALQTLVAAYKK